MYPYYDYRIQYRQNEKLVRDLQRAINGEYSAVQCYERLAILAKSAQEKKQIQEIRQDEARHLREFSQFYRQLTGRQPTPKLSEECPENYRRGLEFAFRDEQETVDFYLDIAEESQDPAIQRAFRRAAADEQQHAVWFLYYLMGQGRQS
ncbi:ferritin-like domain-containing protein [Mesobacillus foraminis]|uniref:ferritin-like domain-containing protein n=1 Tax=Mesobacillus foraminis TaxID=279826 RepID=UPI001BE5FDC7|nr:ferritin-like domain-containing protein [Mesobacillus foraminis]MBT2757057.1 ferritin-like domain-containing protein [Mesobacillus foraminis]